MAAMTGRREHRLRLWHLSATLAALIIAATFWIYAVSSTMPTESVLPRVIPPVPNAKDCFDKAGPLMKGPIDYALETPLHAPKGIAASELADPTSGYHVFSLTEDDALVAQNSAALAEIEKGLPYTYLQPGDIPADDKSTPRRMARLLVLEGMTAAKHGDWTDAVQYYLDCDSVYVDVRRGNMDVGYAMSTPYKLLWIAIDHLTPVRAEKAARRLVDLDNLIPPPASTVASLESSVLPTYLQQYREKGWREPYLNPSNDAAGLLMQHLTFHGLMATLLESPRTAYENCRRFFERSILYYERPWPERNCATPPKPPADPLNSQMQSWDGVLSDMVFGNVKDQTLIRLAEVQAALRAYGGEHGYYPARLSLLVPSYLPAVPIDPFTDGQPLKYKRKGYACVLYSVGPDSVDNGGTPTVHTFEYGQDYRVAMARQKGDIVAGVNY